MTGNGSLPAYNIDKGDNMKLSMWMIANRLEFMDLEIHIQDKAPQVLNSARLANATNCVVVTSDGPDVVCLHSEENDFIRLKNIPLSEGVALIQDVFDFYQDWEMKINQYLGQYDYQNVLDCCWPVFHNPMTLLNGQRRVLAMSSHYKDKRMDDEWAYLLKYHYASVDTAKAHRRSHICLEDETPHLYRRVGQAQYDSLSVPLILDQTVFGRISVLQRDRKLNYGDQQLLELLASGLKRSLSEQRDEDMPYNEDCFTLLLENKLTVQEELSYQLAFFKWKRKSKFQLFLLESPDAAEELEIRLVTDTIRSRLSGSPVIVKGTKVIVILRVDTDDYEEERGFLILAAKDMGLHISCSLIMHDIMHVYYMLRQAVYAMRREEAVEGTFDFYEYAIDYMIESTSLWDRFFAVHPDVLNLWLRKQKYQDTKYDTFRCYLENDRSLIRAATKLFIHRNTLVYHLKRIHELVKYNPEDTYTLDYMKISMRVLNMLERAGGAEGGEQGADAVRLLERLRIENWYLEQDELPPDGSFVLFA